MCSINALMCSISAVMCSISAEMCSINAVMSKVNVQQQIGRRTPSHLAFGSSGRRAPRLDCSIVHQLIA